MRTMGERSAEAATVHAKYLSAPVRTVERFPDKDFLERIPLSDSAVLDAMARSKNGLQIRKLLDGDHSQYESQSEADLALSSRLAFFSSRNPEQMDRMFRNSGLMRPKWDEKHGTGTYGELTIQKAITGCTEVYTPPSAATLRWRKLHSNIGSGSREEVETTKFSRPSSINSPVNSTEGDEPVLGTAKGEGTTLPKIQVNNRQLRDIANETLATLEKSNNPPTLFKRDTGLVRITLAEDKGINGEFTKRPVLEEASEAYIRGKAARSADFFKMKLVKGDVIVCPADPPLILVRDILAMKHWPFPLILGITQSPIMREDGSLFDQSGYDIASCLYYMADGVLVIPPVPERPSVADLANAVSILEEPFQDFPFVDQSSHANILGAVITIALRSLIDGPCPALLLNKHQQGSGATLLANVLSTIGTGSAAYMETWPTGSNSEEELRKRITTNLLAARPLVVFDNVESFLTSATLGSVLTAEKWADRLLGKMTEVRVPQRTVWILNGNNLQVGGDLPRRCYESAIDPKVACPWRRKPEMFKHPELLVWVRANRGAILSAIYTLARSWIIAGRPKAGETPVIGGFEEWTRVVGGILSHAGIKDFLGNLDGLYEQSETDDGWAGFLNSWFEKWKEVPMTSREIVNKLQEDETFCASLPGDLDINDKNLKRKLGYALKKRASVHYINGFYIERNGDAHDGAVWRVRDGVK